MLKIKNFKNIFLYEMEVSKKDKVEITKLKVGEKPSIMSNTMFKTMFYNTKRLKYSAKLISYFVDVSFEDLMSHMKLVKNELDKDYNFSKEERSDYVCDINESKINIEVNNNSDYSTMERNMEYAFRLYSERVKMGDDYRYKYNQVIQINLNNFSFRGNEKIVDMYCFQNNEKIVLNNKINIIQIYVPNLRRKMYNRGKENLEEWEKYLLGLIETDTALSKEIGDDLDIMIEYVNEAGEVTMGTNFGESYDKELALAEEAKKEGREEGIKVGKEEDIKNFYKEGVDIHIISKATGLSIDEIEKLIKNS